MFESLRDWRRKQASSENLPPYCILADRALGEIAARRPQSESELGAVSGLGPVKIQKYGRAVLEVVRGEATSPVAAGVTKKPSIVQADDLLQSVTPSAPKPAVAKSEIPKPVARVPMAAPTMVQVGGATISETVDATRQLLNEGLDVAHIVEARGVTRETVWLHALKLIEARLLDEAVLEVLLPRDERARVEVVVTQMPEAPLRPIFDALDGEIEYGFIRCVLALRTAA